MSFGVLNVKSKMNVRMKKKEEEMGLSEVKHKDKMKFKTGFALFQNLSEM